MGEGIVLLVVLGISGLVTGWMMAGFLRGNRQEFRRLAEETLRDERETPEIRALRDEVKALRAQLTYFYALDDERVTQEPDPTRDSHQAFSDDPPDEGEEYPVYPAPRRVTWRERDEELVRQSYRVPLPPKGPGGGSRSLRPLVPGFRHHPALRCEASDLPGCAQCTAAIFDDVDRMEFPPLAF